MRPWMAAIIVLSVCVAGPVWPVAAQESPPTPRRFPDLEEFLPSDDSQSQVTAAAVTTAQPKSPGFPVIQATGLAFENTTEFVKPVAATSEAWPAGPRPSRITEPVAAPPATPLEAPPDLSGTADRIVSSSPPHTLQVHLPIPQEPPLLPELQSPMPPVEMTSGSEQFIAPPLSSMNSQFTFAEEGMQPIPASPPEPDPLLASSEIMSGWSPEGSYVVDDGLRTDLAGGYPLMEGEMAGMEMAGIDFDWMASENQCAYRNLCAPDLAQPTDPCGEFLPFGNLGIKPGNDRVIVGGGFFIPLWQNCDSMVFTELRGNVDDHRAGDGFIGLGYRTYLDPEWILGTYLYGDLIATKQKNVFGQGQLGFELLSLNWDFRVNGYAPGQAIQSAVTENGISNGTAITRNFGERAYPGFDFEIGRRVLNWGLNDEYEVRWFFGGYGFGRSSNVYPSFGGPRSRVEMRIYDLPWCGQQSRLEFGGEFSYDRVRREQLFGYLRVRIPFGPKQGRPALDPLRRRMVDTPVHRID